MSWNWRDWQKLNRYYPIWLEVPSVLLLIFAFWYLAVHYADLPARIPTHFGFTGLPDNWGPKKSILVMPFIAAAIYLLFTGISLWIAAVDDPRRIISAPEKERKKIQPAAAEAVRVVTLRGLLVLKIFILSLGAYLTYKNVQVALGLAAGIGWVGLVFGIMAAATAFYLGIRCLLLIGSK
ncbi:MAG: hypothetical protein PWP41_2036 [Moorella sp. (in: firmicutes)]|nr:hypothetical protein [Moorella sp. (in: firmicutes)]